jgi:hypothetical protein
MNRLLRRAIRSWLSWRSQRLIDQALPGFSSRKRMIERLQKQHKPVKALQLEHSRAMLNALRGSAE